ITGSDTWTGGNINGTGTTSVAVGATMTLAQSTSIAPRLYNPGRVLNNAGTINWTTGNFCVGDGAILNNAGTFNDQSTDTASITASCVGGAAAQLTNGT